VGSGVRDLQLSFPLQNLVLAIIFDHTATENPRTKKTPNYRETTPFPTSLPVVNASALMKRRKSLATLAKSKPEASADQVQRFERRLREVQQAVAGLPGEEYHAELLKIVHRAGWTTLAEGIFFEATMESILAHTRDLAQLHQKLKAAFEAVQGE
jgi:hypothetical protein